MLDERGIAQRYAEAQICKPGRGKGWVEWPFGFGLSPPPLAKKLFKATLSASVCSVSRLCIHTYNMHTSIFKRLESRLLNPPMNSLTRDLGASFRAGRSKSGLTLVEMTVVIAMILVLAGAASLSIKPYLAYRDGRTAGEMLRAVKAAQLVYLSDNPSTPVANLTQALLLPYMPNATWPTLPSVNGQVPTINCAQFPPVAVLNGAPYDPSGSTTDGLWDVGQY